MADSRCGDKRDQFLPQRLVLGKGAQIILSLLINWHQWEKWEEVAG